MTRFSQEKDRIDILLVREQNTDLWAEGREEDCAFASKPIHFVEDSVDQVIQFHSIRVHSPIVGLEEHWVF